MEKEYQEALTIFGIEQGFVEEQIDEIYRLLKESIEFYETNIFSIQYFEMIRNKMKIKIAYHFLKRPFSHYIVNQNSLLINKEKMMEKIAKLIYDYSRKNKIVDKYFLAQLVEILVSFKNLHHNIKDIIFYPNGTTTALYDTTGVLKIYEENVQIMLRQFPFEHRYYSYYEAIFIIAHEVTHAEQLKTLNHNKEEIETLLWKSCCSIYPQYNDSFQKFFELPRPVSDIFKLFALFVSQEDYKKYLDYWWYSPMERVANIKGTSLALSLIEQVQNKEELKNIKHIFKQELLNFLFFGYDKLLGPTDFYLSQFKQQENRFKLLEMSELLDIESRLLYGFLLTKEEIKKAKENKEKILSRIQNIL